MLKAKIDWLSFTFKTSDEFVPDEFNNFLKAFPEIDEKAEFFVILREGNCQGCYDHVLQFNDSFMVSYRAEPMQGDKQSKVNQGVNVSVPASGLEYFFNVMGYSTDDPITAIENLVNRGCQFSRIDFAYDDFEKVFEPWQYNQWVANGQMVTNFRSFHFVSSTTMKKGGTFYLGKRQSRKMLRIYDKDFESEGKVPAIRYEFELHSEQTKPFVDYILKYRHLPKFTDLLEQFIIKIVTPGDFETRRGRTILPEWDEFVKLGIDAQDNMVESVTVSKEVSDPITSAMDWMETQVLPIFHDMCLLFGEDTMFKKLRKCKHSRNYDKLQTLYYMNYGKYNYIKAGVGEHEYHAKPKRNW